MRAASPPTARGAVLQVLLVDRFHQPRHRSLDDRVRERRLPNRALAPIVLFSPPALYGRRLGAPTASTFVQVAQVRVKVCGIRLRRYPIDTCGARLARVAVCRSEDVFVAQVGQRRTHTIGIVGRLLCHGLECRCDGW